LLPGRVDLRMSKKALVVALLAAVVVVAVLARR
jgi:hypothetical protein